MTGAGSGATKHAINPATPQRVMIICNGSGGSTNLPRTRRRRRRRSATTACSGSPQPEARSRCSPASAPTAWNGAKYKILSSGIGEPCMSPPPTAGPRTATSRPPRSRPAPARFPHREMQERDEEQDVDEPELHDRIDRHPDQVLERRLAPDAHGRRHRDPDDALQGRPDEIRIDERRRLVEHERAAVAGRPPLGEQAREHEEQRHPRIVILVVPDPMQRPVGTSGRGRVSPVQDVPHDHQQDAEPRGPFDPDDPRSGRSKSCVERCGRSRWSDESHVAFHPDRDVNDFGRRNLLTPSTHAYVESRDGADGRRDPFAVDRITAAARARRSRSSSRRGRFGCKAARLEPPAADGFKFYTKAPRFCQLIKIFRDVEHEWRRRTGSMRRFDVAAAFRHISPRNRGKRTEACVDRAIHGLHRQLNANTKGERRGFRPTLSFRRNPCPIAYCARCNPLTDTSRRCTSSWEFAFKPRWRPL